MSRVAGDHCRAWVHGAREFELWQEGLGGGVMAGRETVPHRMGRDGGETDGLS